MDAIADRLAEPHMATVVGNRHLAHIARNCTRWAAVDALPTAIKRRMQDIEALAALLRQDAATGPAPLAAIKKSCLDLKKEFARARIAFDCPFCPLQAK